MLENVKDIIARFFQLAKDGMKKPLMLTHNIPDEFSDQENKLTQVELIQYVVNVYINGILCLFGFVGNSLTIYILQKDKARNSNGIFLQAVAAFDMLLLMFTFFYTILRSVYPATGHMENYFNASPYIIAFVLPVGWIAQTGTIWFTMYVAGDRYLAISKPFKATTISTVGNAKRLTLLTSAVAVIFNLPRFFHYSLVALHSNSNSTFVGHIRIKLPNWNEDLYHYFYHIVLTFIFLYIIPLSALVFFNIKLIGALKKAHSQRVRLSGGNGQNILPSHIQNRSITLNLVIVITKFIICQTPDFIAAIVGATAMETDHDPYKIFATFKEMLLVFNSAINFYIYLIFNIKFRQAMKECCCRHCGCCPSKNEKPVGVNCVIVRKNLDLENHKDDMITRDAHTPKDLVVSEESAQDNTFIDTYL